MTFAEVLKLLLAVLGFALAVILAIGTLVGWLVHRLLRNKDTVIVAKDALIKTKDARIEDLLYKISELEKKMPEAIIEKYDSVLEAWNRIQGVHNKEIASQKEELARVGADHEKATKRIQELESENRKLSVGSAILGFKRELLSTGVIEAGLSEWSKHTLKLEKGDVTYFVPKELSSRFVHLDELEQQSKNVAEKIKDLKDAQKAEAEEQMGDDAMDKALREEMKEAEGDEEP